MPFDENYFSSHTYQDVSFNRFGQYWWSNRFYAILARRYGRRGARLLEIGSGLGHLVGQLQDHFIPFGVDINLWALQRSLPTAEATVFSACDAEELPFATGIFGVVIIKHIVEHLSRPERAIAEIGRVVEKGGVVILATPNLASRMRPLKGEGWIGYRDPTHISLKAPEAWLEILAGEGFEIEKVFSDGFWDPPYVGLLPKVVQKVLFGAGGGLQAVTGIPFLPLQWGESMIVIARKKNDPA